MKPKKIKIGPEDRDERSDSVLGNLPQARKEEIYLRLTQPWPDGTAPSGARVAAWLALDGLKVSESQLSRFRSSVAGKESADTMDSLLTAFEEHCKKLHPEWTADKVRETAINFFMVQTAGNQDVKNFALVVQLDQAERFGRTKAAQKDRQLNQADLKIYLASDKRLEALLLKAKELLGDVNLSQATRIAEMRQAMFADVEEFAKSAKFIPLPRRK
jgi:hypothetical protein